MQRPASPELSDATDAPVAVSLARVRWLMLVYFLSGACSLMDEVVWVRLLKDILGNTVYATSIVVSVFMGGLALGALIMARYADRARRRLRLYAWLEGLVTLSALGLPFALVWADSFYSWCYRAFKPGHGALLLIQAALSAVLLLVPTLLMGSTLPLMGRCLTGLRHAAGRLVGRLYAMNTLGAAVGCFAAGFVFIRAFGVMGTLYLAAALNALVAGGGWWLSRRWPEEAEAPALRPEAPQAAQPVDAGLLWITGALFVSGLVSIGYEILWMRSIVHLLGGYTYVFSAVLTVYLLGNVMGSGLASGLTTRLRRPGVAFGVSLFLLGAFGVLYLPLMVVWTSRGGAAMDEGIHAMAGLLPFSAFLARPILHSTLLFLVPSILMGIGFPIALQAYADHAHGVGVTTGKAYGANAIGAVLGGVLTGFVLIPRIGVQGAAILLALLAVWAGAALWAGFWGNHRPLWRWAGPALAALASLAALQLPAGLFAELVVKAQHPFAQELLAVREGVTTTVSVHRNRKTGNLGLYSSGQILAGDHITARGDQKMLGHLGPLLHEGAREVLSVGFGSGETTRCLSLRDLERIDCVEIAPEIVEVSLNHFRHLNLGARLDDAVNMVFMDAKNYLHLSETAYDVIVNDSIHPRTFAENASLYTREYFEDARRRLKSGGLFMTWVPTYEMPERVLRSILGTLGEVFPHVTLWFLAPSPSPLVLAVASVDPQMFRPDHIDALLADPEIGADLAGINIFSSLDLLSCYVGDEQDLAPVLAGYSSNRDNAPFVEFLIDPDSPARDILADYVLDVRSRSLGRHLELGGMEAGQRSAFHDRYARRFETLTRIMPERMSFEDHSPLPAIDEPPGDASVPRAPRSNLRSDGGRPDVRSETSEGV